MATLTEEAHPDGSGAQPVEPATAHGSAASRRLHAPMPSAGWRGWWGPLAVTLLAGILRFVDLGRPRAIIFDETYYVKDALALLRFGHERQTVDGANQRILDQGGRPAGLDIFTENPGFVVHPPVGKWVIAAGEWAFGVTPFGWRFGVALLGTLSVLMTARILRRLTRSDVIGTLAGLLVALDGLHLVMSRTALLDISLMFFVLAAFGLLLLDRDQMRSRLDARGFLPVTGAGPRLGMRWWRLAAGVSLGLACGVKWSGVWYLALFGLLAVGWDWQLRRALGVARPALAVLRRDVPLALVSLVGVAAVVYLATWSGWLLSDGGYDRQWALDHPGGLPLVPDALRSLAAYHRAAWGFNVGLEKPHAYQSSAWSWLIESRPTSFHFSSDSAQCGADRCSEAVLALGNPVIWWAGLLAMGHTAWRAIAGRDWRATALLVAFAAGWVPWQVFHGRTIFFFYAVVYVPFVAGMLAMSLASLPGGPDASPARRRIGLVVAGIVVLAVVATTWYFLPIWTGSLTTFREWHMRMWMPSWV